MKSLCNLILIEKELSSFTGCVKLGLGTSVRPSKKACCMLYCFFADLSALLLITSRAFLLNREQAYMLTYAIEKSIKAKEHCSNKGMQQKSRIISCFFA
jgi:hypothetical protein